MEVYIELSVGCTRTCSLGRVFTKYLSGAITLSNSISGFILTTPDMKIGGGLWSMCCVGASFVVSSMSVLNRFEVGRVSPNQ